MFETRWATSLCLCGALFVGAFFVAGCGEVPPETSPFEGTYQIIQHVRNTSGCDASGDTVRPGKRFRLALSGEGDNQKLVYYTCRDEGEACDGTVSETNSFDQKKGADWQRVDVEIFQIIDGCNTKLEERVATLEGNGVVIDVHTYEGTPSREDDQECDEAFARDHRDELECTRSEHIEATRVE